jgi:hypothetical protein
MTIALIWLVSDQYNLQIKCGTVHTSNHLPFETVRYRFTEHYIVILRIGISNYIFCVKYFRYGDYVTYYKETGSDGAMYISL